MLDVIQQKKILRRLNTINVFDFEYLPNENDKLFIHEDEDNYIEFEFKKGKWRNSRYRLFATEIFKIDGIYKLKPKGKPCLNLIDSLLQLDELKLQKNIGAVGKNSGTKLAPKEYGLNIEGMTISADGKDLYIGMRNPVPGNRAILIPLKNIDDVILTESDPKLGTPIYLNLANRGIRSIEYSSAHQMYFIIAGSISGAVSYTHLTLPTKA